MANEQVLPFGTIVAIGATIQQNVNEIDRFIAMKGKDVRYWSPDDVIKYIDIMSRTAEQLNALIPKELPEPRP